MTTREQVVRLQRRLRGKSLAALGALTRRQKGAALVVLLTLLVLASSAILLDHLTSEVVAKPQRDPESSDALAEAKAALIAWSVLYPPQAPNRTTPGILPFPDRGDEAPVPNYDGNADCPTVPVNEGHLVGRLPWAGEVPPCDTVRLFIDTRDGAGEPLWYAVSRNLVRGGAGGPINPDMGGPNRMDFPWLSVFDVQANDYIRDASGQIAPIAAVIIAPGPILGTQDRGGAAPAALNYLESLAIGPPFSKTIDNADADGCYDDETAPCSSGEEFVLHRNPLPEDNFNDRLVYITVDELMRAVEKRVLGEVALALDSYRNGNSPPGGWNPNGVYPWLAPFRSPRGRFYGSVDLAAGTSFIDNAGPGVDFTLGPDPVQKGDIVYDVTQDVRGPIVNVIPPSGLTVDALEGGATFAFNDDYVVEPKFESVAGLREGSLPVHLPNQIFYTDFNGTWDFTGGAGDPDFTPINPLPPPTAGGGVLAFVPPEDDVKSGTFNVVNGGGLLGNDEGRCMWEAAAVVHCYGKVTFSHFRGPPISDTVQRTVEVSFSFTGDSVAVAAPTNVDVRRRNVSVTANPLPPYIPGVAPRLPNKTWNVKITDTYLGNSGWLEATIDADTGGSIQVNGIRYDLSVVYDDVDDANDELPEWFAENNWHHFVYAAFSDDAVAALGANPDADADCTTWPGPPTVATPCLTVNVGGVGVRSDVRALLVSAGVQWTNQERTLGDCNGDADGPTPPEVPEDDSFLCAYFESDNNDLAATPNVYARDVYSATFNDSVRIIDPLPP